MNIFRFCVHELALRYHLRIIEAPNLMTHQQTGVITVVSQYDHANTIWLQPHVTLAQLHRPDAGILRRLPP